MSALASPPATTLDNTDESSPACPQSVKLKRVLACALCQQRKVKCDRKIPCTRCIQAGAQSRCVAAPTVGPRQRRRRFPERELLERLRFYEGLLRENGIEMGEPLHPPIGDKDRNTAHRKAIPEPLPRPDQAMYDPDSTNNSCEYTHFVPEILLMPLVASQVLINSIWSLHQANDQG